MCDFRPGELQFYEHFQHLRQISGSPPVFTDTGKTGIVCQLTPRGITFRDLTQVSPESLDFTTQNKDLGAEMKRTFEIEWPDECGPLWMNTSNLLICLTETCQHTRFTVRDVTGDGEASTEPESAGPISH